MTSDPLSASAHKARQDWLRCAAKQGFLLSPEELKKVVADEAKLLREYMEAPDDPPEPAAWRPMSGTYRPASSAKSGLINAARAFCSPALGIEAKLVDELPPEGVTRIAIKAPAYRPTIWGRAKRLLSIVSE
jgi:hypothetical protein